MRERGGGGGPGGFGPGGFGGMGMAGGGSGRQQQRRGTVMVKKADGTLEARQVVIGVSDRVHGQVLEGLTEGEEVVVGKREEEAAAASATQTNTQNNQNFRPDNFRGGGGFPGGGRPF
jgi:macrolide-specific efflux system membrane fusion protein